MKVCPTCGEVYAERAQRCRAHGDELVEWADVTDTHSAVHPRVGGDDTAPHALDVGFAAGELGFDTQASDVWTSAPADTPRVFSRFDLTRTRAPRGGRLLDNRYRLGKQLGVGGYGAVFDGSDERTGTRVAIKVLSPTAAQSPELLTRFHREAIAASRARHHNIVHVEDFDVDDDGTQFIVMEYLDGTDLLERLDDTPRLPPRTALAIAAQCASGLAAAHAKGILHRDLKPANVFLTQQGKRDDFVKIIDFGISKLTQLAGHYSALTGASKVVGTPCYMSPEQATGDELDGRSDVYGLGVILYEMLTGERPFTGDSTLDILSKHIEAPRVAPSTRHPELANYVGLDELVLTALEADKEDRYESMEEFHDAILECLQLIDPRRAAALMEAHITAPDEATPRPLSAHRRGDVRFERPHPARRWRAPLAVAVATVGALLVVVWSLRAGDAENRPASPAAKPTPVAEDATPRAAAVTPASPVDAAPAPTAKQTPPEDTGRAATAQRMPPADAALPRADTPPVKRAAPAARVQPPARRRTTRPKKPSSPGSGVEEW